MINNPFPNFPTLSLKQLGKVFSVTSIEAGKWLKQAGLRLPNGEPTPKAIELGLAIEFVPSDGSHPFWAWANDETVEFLVQTGHKPASPPSNPLPQTPTPSKPVEPLQQLLPIGPFEARRNNAEGDAYEIVASNGVWIWCRGESLALKLVKLLNICWKCGKWFV